MPEKKRALVIGGTGFVGGHLIAQLKASDWIIRGTSRDPARARSVDPELEWVALDVQRMHPYAAALKDCQAVFYLVHGMSEGGDYEKREAQAAVNLVHATADSEVERIVYLGGVMPQGEPSKHLRSRLRTGQILRAGPVPCFELRAAMIIGAGSASWKICRDLAARLPLMLCPRWLESQSCPIGVDDVCAALQRSLDLSLDDEGCYDLPGPEALSAKDMLMRVAELRGSKPRAVNVPLLSPWLSSHWLQWVTRADHALTSELVLGLQHHLLPSQPLFWQFMPDYRVTPLDVAVMRALKDDIYLPFGTMLVEGFLHSLARKKRD